MTRGSGTRLPKKLFPTSRPSCCRSKRRHRHAPRAGKLKLRLTAMLISLLLHHLYLRTKLSTYLTKCAHARFRLSRCCQVAALVAALKDAVAAIGATAPPPEAASCTQKDFLGRPVPQVPVSPCAAFFCMPYDARDPRCSGWYPASAACSSTPASCPFSPRRPSFASRCRFAVAARIIESPQLPGASLIAQTSRATQPVPRA